MTHAILSPHSPEDNTPIPYNPVAPEVEIVDGIPRVSSLAVAEHFGKQHKDVLRDIRRILSECPKDFGERNFALSSYISEQGKELPMYLLTRDAFSLLAMGFTGKEAAGWKIRYIEAFNAMEAELSSRALPNFHDPVLAARAWADAQEQKQLAEKRTLALEAQARLDRPKVLFAEAVDAAQTSMLIGDFAKILRQNGVDMGQNRFFDWLRANGYLVKQHGAAWNSPTQKSMELALFEIKETVFNRPDGHIKLAKTTKLTGRGQRYFVEKFQPQFKRTEGGTI